ncbi:MAG: hypothetical protein JJ902_04195 [Roseibium sp.]|nr:hypothetical protein [Roseibium sp.]
MEGATISFVTWPDGKVSQASLTVAGEDMARQKVIAEWMPERYFGDAINGFMANAIWRGMCAKGFKSWTIRIGADGSPELDEH